MPDIPLILSENYIALDCTIVSSGYNTIESLFDGLVGTCWSSVGSCDSQIETIDVKFYELGSQVYRFLDRLGILKHNLRDFDFQYFDGANWQSLVGMCDNTNPNIFQSFAGICCNEVRLRMNRTIGGVNEKQVSELFVGKLKYTFPRFPEGFEPDRVVGEGSFRTAYGNLKFWREFERMVFVVSLLALSGAEKEVLENLYEESRQVTFYPLPETDPEGLYQVKWSSPFGGDKFYSVIARDAGYNIEMRFEQL